MLKVAILFGGESTEHEVSIITGLQVINNIDKTKFLPIPVYVSKNGQWFAVEDKLSKIETYRNLAEIEKNTYNAFIPPDSTLKGLLQNPSKAQGLFRKVSMEEFNVAFLCFHGNTGENGSVQGLLELAGIPYVGSGVLASALCMDKISTKSVLRSIGLPLVKDYFFLREEWNNNTKNIFNQIEKTLKYPLFIKPSNGGSTIGVRKANNRKQLIEAIEVAKFYDRRILVEESVENAKEINISVLGYKNLDVSACEQPIRSSELLSYEDKYVNPKGKSAGMTTAKRLIPAPIKERTKINLEKYAKIAFRQLDCAGVIRIDFLASQNEKEIYLNEVNTIPGSMSFYLWEPTGLKFQELITKLVELAVERHDDQHSTVHTFKSNILENFAGTKG